MGFNFFVPQNTREFDYLLPDSTFKTKAGHVCGVIGLQFSKTQKLPKPFLFDRIDYITGLGVGFIQTVAKQQKANPSDQDHYYSITTLHLSGGISLKRPVFKNKYVGTCTISLHPVCSISMYPKGLETAASAQVCNYGFKNYFLKSMRRACLIQTAVFRTGSNQHIESVGKYSDC